MNRVVHFEIQVDDPKRAIKFYEEVFGWKFQKWPPQEYWMVMTDSSNKKDPGINGGLLLRSAKNPPTKSGANAFVCTIEVDDFDKIAKKVVAFGGKLAQPKYAMPGMAWLGYFIDTESNTFGLYQVDPNAK